MVCFAYFCEKYVTDKCRNSYAYGKYYANNYLLFKEITKKTSIRNQEKPTQKTKKTKKEPGKTNLVTPTTRVKQLLHSQPNEFIKP